MSNRAFGYVLGDRTYNNMTVTGRLQVNQAHNRGEGSLPVDPTVVVLEEDPITNPTYTLTPPADQTVIYTFSAPLATNTTIQFDVNNENAFIGQEMIWIFSNAQPSIITVIVDANFSNLSQSIPANGKIAQYWMYNGSKWSVSVENC